MGRRGGVTFLIDTHYLLWAGIWSSRMEPWAKALIGDLNNSVLVSTASIYEIGTKVRKGKLPEAIEFEQNLIENIAALGYTVVGLSPAVMLRAARFPANHPDPFDRMIAAQAIELDVDLLSVDPRMEDFAVRRLKAPPARPPFPPSA